MKRSHHGGLHHRHPSLPAPPDLHEQRAAGSYLACCLHHQTFVSTKLQVFTCSYIIDTPSCLYPQTFMSNVLQVASCSWCPQPPV